MSGVAAVFKRELASYFATPIAYVFIVIFLVLAGVFTFFYGGFYETRPGGSRGVLLLAPVAVPVPRAGARACGSGPRSENPAASSCSMTLPLEVWQAVAGKFLAAWAFTAISIALTFPIWITVNYLGDPDNGVIVAAYFGSILMAGGFLAVGACISAATKNQVIAFILSVVACFVLLAPGLGVVQQLLSGIAPQWLVDGLASLGLPGALRLHQQRRHRLARSRLFRAADRRAACTPTRSCSS